MNYLESPQTARNPGVADFYLGATLIERSMLANPARRSGKGLPRTHCRHSNRPGRPITIPCESTFLPHY